MKKEVKKVNEHPMQIELAELNKLTRYVIEQRDLLNQVEAESLDAFETALNTATNFRKASLSAEAMGLEEEHYRLMELEKILDGKLEEADVDANGNLTNKKLKEVKEKHTVYWSDSELEMLKKLKQIIGLYNDLSPQDRQKLVVNRSGEMQVSPMLSRY